jgi:hypothetical protein
MNSDSHERIEDDCSACSGTLRNSQTVTIAQASRSSSGMLARHRLEAESAGLDSAISRILECADVIPLSKEVMQHSVRIREQFSLQPQDSVVFASVDLYLSQRASERSIFANRTSRDFAVPDVQSRLAELHCTLLTSFSSTLTRIEQLGVARRRTVWAS